MKVRIKEGGRYIRRNGTVTPPLEQDERGDSTVFYDPETKYCFNNRNRLGCLVCRGEPDRPEDLVAEFFLPEEFIKGVDEWFKC